MKQHDAITDKRKALLMGLKLLFVGKIDPRVKENSLLGYSLIKAKPGNKLLCNPFPYFLSFFFFQPPSPLFPGRERGRGWGVDRSPQKNDPAVFHVALFTLSLQFALHILQAAPRRYAGLGDKSHTQKRKKKSRRGKKKKG